MASTTAWSLGLATLIVLGLSGCLTGTYTYRGPATSPPTSNAITIERPFDDVWKVLVPGLGKRFFVINNIDKASGLVNLSYSGNPETYVDCGQMTIFVKNARGDRTYNFPAASAHQVYESVDDGSLFFLERKVSLEGRMNLIVQQLSETQTQVTANTRYIITRSAQSRRVDLQYPASISDTISFNSGQSASFAPRGKNQPVTCRPTGRFENDVLDIVR